MKGVTHNLVNDLDEFETKKACQEEAAHRIKTLRRSEKIEHRVLADKLESCGQGKNNSCNSPACPICNREKRILFYDQVMRTINASKANDEQQKFVIININFYDRRMSNKELLSFSPNKLNNRLRKLLKRSGYHQFATGLIDFVFDKKFDPKAWLPHYHLVACGPNSNFNKLRKSLKCTQDEKTPLKINPLKDYAKQVSYTSKLMIRMKTGSGTTSNKKRLPPKEFRLSLHMIDQWGFKEMQFLYGLRKTHGDLIRINKSDKGKTKNKVSEQKNTNCNFSFLYRYFTRGAAQYYLVRFTDLHGNTIEEPFEETITQPTSSGRMTQKMKDKLSEFGMPRPYITKHSDEIQTILNDPDSVPNGYLAPRHGHIEFDGRQYYVTSGNVITAGDKKSDHVLLDPKIDKGNFQPSGQKGSLADWRDNLAIHAKHSPIITLVISTSLAALIDQKIVHSGGFHIYDSSSQGKTTAFTVGRTVMGPTDRNSTWSATAAALEERATGHNNSALYLDDIKLLSPHPRELLKLVTDTIYRLSSECVKQRYSHHEGDNYQTWAIQILSNGEFSITELAEKESYTRYDGEDVRLIEIPSDCGKRMGIFTSLPDNFDNSADFAKHLQSLTREFYGSAGPHFIQKLLKHGSTKITEKTEYHMMKFREKAGLTGIGNTEGRRIDRFALLYAAGRLAITFKILPLNKGALFKHLMFCYQQSIKAKQQTLKKHNVALKDTKKSIQEIINSDDLIDIRGKTKITRKESQAPGFISTRNENTVIILKTDTVKAAIENESPRRKAMKILAQKGLLIKGNDNKYTQRTVKALITHGISRAHYFKPTKSVMKRLNKV